MASGITKLNEKTIKDIDKKETFSSANNEHKYNIQELESQIRVNQIKIIELKNKVETLENDLQEQIKRHDKLLEDKWKIELTSLCNEHELSIISKEYNIDNLENLENNTLEARIYSLSTILTNLREKNRSLQELKLALNITISHLSVEKKSLENEKNKYHKSKSSNIDSQDSSYEQCLHKLQEEDRTINELDNCLSELENKLQIQTSDNDYLLEKIKDIQKIYLPHTANRTNYHLLLTKNLDKLDKFNLAKKDDIDKINNIVVLAEISGTVLFHEQDNIKQQEEVDLLQKKVDQLRDENKTLSYEIEQINMTLINPNHANTTHSTFNSHCCTLM